MELPYVAAAFSTVVCGQLRAQYLLINAEAECEPLSKELMSEARDAIIEVVSWLVICDEWSVQRQESAKHDNVFG